MAAEDRVRIRDLPSLSLRLPGALRVELEREAFAHRRSLAAECLLRIEASFSAAAAAADKPEASAKLGAREPVAPYALMASGADGVTKLQRELLDRFASLTGEQQLALLTLLRR